MFRMAPYNPDQITSFTEGNASTKEPSTENELRVKKPVTDRDKLPNSVVNDNRNLTAGAENLGNLRFVE